MDARKTWRPRLLFLARASRFGLAGYLVLRAIFGPVLWPLSVIEPLLLWLCLPSFALVFVAFARRRWAAASAHTLIASAWALMFGHLLFAPEAPPPASGPTLSLISFNVGAGTAQAHEIARLLAEEAADVVLIQELDKSEELALARELLDVYPHRDLRGLGIDGMGIFSKFPILEVELVLPESRRPFQRAVLDVRGERVAVWNVHPGLVRLLCAPFTSDADELRRMADAARAAGPALIAGDFNATENMDLCRLLEAAELRDAFRAAGSGFGFTFPVFGKYRGWPVPPLARIDYVWHTAAFRCREARVLREAGSDHLPLKVVLERN